MADPARGCRGYQLGKRNYRALSYLTLSRVGAVATAYATGGAAMKDKAKGDPDLAEMRKQPVYKELFTG